MLIYAVSQGIIDLDDVRNSMKEKEKERLLSKHKYKMFQGKDGRWRTTIPDETKKDKRRLLVKSSYEALVKEVISFYAEQEDEEEERKILITVRKVFPVWLNYKSKHTDSSSYIKRIKTDWNKYYEESDIVDVPICNLTYHMLDEWAHDMVKNNNLTKKQYYNMSIIMRQCLDYAVEEGYIESNVFSRVHIDGKLFYKKPKPASKTQVFTVNNEKDIYDAAIKRYMRTPKSITPLAIMINFNLGLRVCELVALKWSDISEDNYIHVQRMEVTEYKVLENGEVERIGVKVVERTKSSAGDRCVFLNQNVRELLSCVRKRSEKYGLYDDDYIFVNAQSDRLTGSSINGYLYNLCDDVNTYRKSSHKIRKTYISSLFDKGININKIREIAGHEDERTSLNNYCFDRNTDTENEKALNDLPNAMPIQFFRGICV